MNFFHFFTVILILGCHIHFTVGESIDCDVGAKIGQVALKIQYDRKELGIYKYNNTQLVNVLLPFVNVTYVNSSQARKSSPLLNTTIDGLAVLTGKSKLDECDLVVRTNLKSSQDFPISLQRDLLSSAKSCFEKQLCDRIQEVTQDDFLRASLEKYDFGENTVFFHLLSQRYPVIDLETKRDRRAARSIFSGTSALQTSLNALADFLLVSAISCVSSNALGIIKIPDQYVAKGLATFNVTNGTFGDLTQVLRAEDVRVTNEGARYTISVAFQLPNAHIRFDRYDLKLLISLSGSAMINVGSVTFSAQIVVDYNSNPCKISAGYLRTRIEDVKFELSNGIDIVDKATNGIVNFGIDKFAHNIVEFIKNKLRTAIGGALENVDCEKFRPRLN